MLLKKDCCETCKAETIDRYLSKGWIHIEDAKISVSKRRDKKGTAITGYSNGPLLDFCSYKCLQAWLAVL
jgi:hypothetical protein